MLKSTKKYKKDPKAKKKKVEPASAVLAQFYFSMLRYLHKR